MTILSRRSFVRRAACGLAGLTTATLLPNSVRGANDKIRVAAIGVRTQGMIMARSFIKTGRADIAAVCDVDGQILAERMKEIESLQKKAPKAYADFRRVLEDKDVDAVLVATPDHWHAIMAIRSCEAGKDVYLEKPCAHNVRECRLIAQAARKYSRIIQHGTMQRSGAHFQEAREYVRSGKLGKIGLIRCFSILGRASIGHKPAGQPPAGLDYDFWLGPAPQRPYNENRGHYNWRFIWDYGTGDMGNWGVHWLDIPLWTLDLGWPDAVCCSGGKFIYDDDKETPDTQLTFYEYPHLSLVWELRMWSKYPNQGGIDDSGTGVTFYGDEQVLNVTRAGWKAFTKDEKKLIAQGHAGDDKFLLHANNFIDCVQSRKAPIADIASGHVSAAVAILGNVAWLAGEKIRYDPVKEKLDKSEKDPLLTRTYRDKWPLPVV